MILSFIKNISITAIIVLLLNPSIYGNIRSTGYSGASHESVKKHCEDVDLEQTDNVVCRGSIIEHKNNQTKHRTKFYATHIGDDVYQGSLYVDIQGSLDTWHINFNFDADILAACHESFNTFSCSLNPAEAPLNFHITKSPKRLNNYTVRDDRGLIHYTHKWYVFRFLFKGPLHTPENLTVYSGDHPMNNVLRFFGLMPEYPQVRSHDEL